MVWKRQPFRRMPDTECPTRGYGLQLGGEFAMAKIKLIVVPWAFAAGVMGAMLIAGASGGARCGYRGSRSNFRFKRQRGADKAWRNIYYNPAERG